MTLLLDSLLTKGIPTSLRSVMARQEHGTYPTSLDMDDGYANPVKLQEIQMIAFRDAERWLHDEFPRLWRSIPYGVATVSEDTDLGYPAIRINVSTGGYSGCEEVIEAMLSHPWMDRCCVQRQAGGHYIFKIRSPAKIVRSA